MLAGMRFWFEHSSEVSLREQVVTQVTLGILSGELAPGERLPSIRELARRFDLHANTVSGGYQQLQQEGWVESRKGSGVYVRDRSPQPPASSDAEAALTRLIANLFETTKRLGIPDRRVAEYVRARTQPAAVGRVLVVEPDLELRRIVIAELSAAITVPIEGCDLGELRGNLETAVIVALPSKVERVSAEAAGFRVHSLRVRSIPIALSEHLAASHVREGVLIGIASHWLDFLRFARTMLVAAGFDVDALIVRPANTPGWQDGLAQADAVVCDVVTATELTGVKTILSRVLADGVPEEIKALTQPQLS